MFPETLASIIFYKIASWCLTWNSQNKILDLCLQNLPLDKPKPAFLSLSFPMDKGNLIHGTRFFKELQTPLRRANKGPDAQKSTACRILRIEAFFLHAETHSWQHVLVRGIWKLSPFCHPAKFKIDLPLKFLDAFTEYNIQAEVSRRPGCFL